MLKSRTVQCRHIFCRLVEDHSFLWPESQHVILMSRPPGDERNLAPSENYLLGHRKRINDCLRGLSDFLRCGDRHSERWRRVKTRLACGCGFNEAAERVSGRRFALSEHVGWIKERPRKLLFPLTSHLCHYTPVTAVPEKGFFFLFPV